MSDVISKTKYKVQPHSEHKRLRHIEFDRATIRQFLELIQDVPLQQIDYIPFMRFYLADKLREIVGYSFQGTISEILRDYNTGGFTIGLSDQTSSHEDYVKFATGITHLLGVPNFDDMSENYYARFTVKHTFDSDTYLRQAYRTLELHTDGTFVSEDTDWILMMKMNEQNAIGGESRLLHLEDWDEMENFINHPLSAHHFKFSYADRASKNVQDDVYRQTFSKGHNGHPCMSYNHQCTHPENIEQAQYLKKIQDSMEKSPGTTSVNLPVGHLVMLNNHFWLHGREAFEENPDFSRELMRQRGCFSKV